MADRITREDLDKAARNLERLAVFVGERRNWILAEDGEESALATRETAHALADLLAAWDADRDEVTAGILKPSPLEPTGRISAGRMLKFSEFLDQLFNWFDSHQDAELEEEMVATVHTMRASLMTTAQALTQLLGPAAALGGSPETGGPLSVDGEAAEAEDFGPLTSPDLGPVAEVDMKAKLVLEDTITSPLLQEFRGVVELTADTKQKVHDFLDKQGVQMEGNELRRLHDKVLKWVEGIPEGRVLVIKISGLSGTPQPYSSYQSKDSLVP